MQFSSRHTSIILFIIATFFLATVALAQNQTQVLNCVPPPPICKPGSFSNVVLDTSLLYPGNFKYSIEPLHSPVNSTENDNAVAFVQKNGELIGLLSSSRAKDNQSKAGVQTVFPFTFKNLYSSSEPKPLIDRKEVIVYGSPYYCPQDRKLYFASKAANDDPNDFDIYTAELDLSGSEPRIHTVVLLDKISRNFSFDSHPTLSKDGLTLYFATDRPGGQGGVDLWYSKRTSTSSSEWSLPNDCGKTINTACDELSPSVSRNGKILYFSSNGHATVGGYDLFSSVITTDGFANVKNMGKDINTPCDEIFPYDLNDSLFFYSSNQPAPTTGRNIFVVHRTQIPLSMVSVYSPSRKATFDPMSGARISADDISHIGTSPQDSSPITVQGRVRIFNDTSRAPTDATVFWRDADKNIELGRKSVDSSGEYSFSVNRGKEYEVGAESKDKFYDVQPLDLRNVEGNVIKAPTLEIPDTLLLRIKFPFDEFSHPYDFTVDDRGEQSKIKWQTSLDLITSSIKTDLAKLRNVILFGHTDQQGTDAYNYALAQKRAQFIAAELEARGVPKKLLKVISKGKTTPVIRREGESDELFDLRCRRVEFVKIFK